MKKIILLLFAIFLVASAINVWTEKPCWQLNGNGWVLQSGNEARCRKFIGRGSLADSCNKERWDIDFKDTLSLAQWIIWNVQGNKLLDLVRKPGTFAGIGPRFSATSNDDVVVKFEGFGNLRRIVGCPPETDSIIEKHYGLSDTWVINPGGIDWMTAEQLNAYSLTFPMRNEGYTKKLWEKIEVSTCNPACEYEDPGGATIVLTLTTIKPWIDSLTGYYRPILP